MSRKLTVTDIADLREYEREREDFRAEVIALKKKRRIAVGPFVTVLFENRQTIRFQIQEMARVERLISDEAIEGELRAYNPLIPEPGELAATVFLELTSEIALREWLPRLVGIEASVALRLGTGEGADPGPGRDRGRSCVAADPGGDHGIGPLRALPADARRGGGGCRRTGGAGHRPPRVHPRDRALRRHRGRAARRPPALIPRSRGRITPISMSLATLPEFLYSREHGDYEE